MNKILLLSAVFISTLSSSFAADKIYNIGYTTGIVADDTEWSCTAYPGSGNDPRVKHGGKYILGNSKHFPLSFVFYSWNPTVTDITNFLRDYAVKTNSVLSEVTVREDTQHKRVVEGRFFDNTSSGYFQVCCLYKGGGFVMFSTIKSEMLDVHSRTILYNSVHDLITPLYNPKALNLWLEAIEKGECDY